MMDTPAQAEQAPAQAVEAAGDEWFIESWEGLLPEGWIQYCTKGEDRTPYYYRTATGRTGASVCADLALRFAGRGAWVTQVTDHEEPAAVRNAGVAPSSAQLEEDERASVHHLSRSSQNLIWNILPKSRTVPSLFLVLLVEGA